MKTADPARMSPDDRLAELGELLARGFQRLVARDGKPRFEQQNVADQLDVLAHSEAPCGDPIEANA